MSEQHREDDEQQSAEGGQVSEVSGMEGDPGPIQPADATAGSPDPDVQEGTAGPDATPQHGRPEEKGEQTQE